MYLIQLTTIHTYVHLSYLHLYHAKPLSNFPEFHAGRTAEIFFWISCETFKSSYGTLAGFELCSFCSLQRATFAQRVAAWCCLTNNAINHCHFMAFLVSLVVCICGNDPIWRYLESKPKQGWFHHQKVSGSHNFLLAPTTLVRLTTQVQNQIWSALHAQNMLKRAVTDVYIIYIYIIITNYKWQSPEKETGWHNC